MTFFAGAFCADRPGLEDALGNPPVRADPERRRRQAKRILRVRALKLVGSARVPFLRGVRRQVSAYAAYEAGLEAGVLTEVIGETIHDRDPNWAWARLGGYAIWQLPHSFAYVGSS